MKYDWYLARHLSLHFSSIILNRLLWKAFDPSQPWQTSSAGYWGSKLKEGCFSHLEALHWSRQGDTAGFQLFSLLSRFASENARIGTSRRFYAKLPAQRDCLLWPTAILYTCIYRQSPIDDLNEIICECATPRVKRRLTYLPSYNGLSRGLNGVVCFFLIGPPCASQRWDCGIRDHSMMVFQFNFNFAVRCHQLNRACQRADLLRLVVWQSEWYTCWLQKC